MNYPNDGVHFEYTVHVTMGDHCTRVLDFMLDIHIVVIIDTIELMSK